MLTLQIDRKAQGSNSSSITQITVQRGLAIVVNDSLAAGGIQSVIEKDGGQELSLVFTSCVGYSVRTHTLTGPVKEMSLLIQAICYGYELRRSRGNYVAGNLPPVMWRHGWLGGRAISNEVRKALRKREISWATYLALLAHFAPTQQPAHVMIPKNSLPDVVAMLADGTSFHDAYALALMAGGPQVRTPLLQAA